MPPTHILETPGTQIKRLTFYFIAWKTLIFLVAWLSPGIGYDTSTSLLEHSITDINAAQDVPVSFNNLAFKFIRWDAIYFTQIAQRGHVFEQEWAFGKGFSTTLQTVAQVFITEPTIISYAFIGIVISHLAHWMCVLLLFLITSMLERSPSSNASSTPFVAALLHIVSPAGVFLTAPYMESLFSFLNLLGFYLYMRGTSELYVGTTGRALMTKLCSGIVFALASTIRSNGILSGVPYLIDAVQTAVSLISPHVSNFAKPDLLLQLQFTSMAGCCVGIGIVFPQYLAYKEYCIDSSGDRPWCKALPPSIFTFVQSHYWQVGFLRYWTLSNIPLYLLASPSLYILITSGLKGIRPIFTGQPTMQESLQIRLATPQLILALLAITNYHVQIITRLAPAYPFWYIWFARNLQDWRASKWMIYIFTMYGLIQTGLFASFLPPA